MALAVAIGSPIMAYETGRLGRVDVLNGGIIPAGPIADRRFEIEFLDPGVEAFSFTFG